MQDKLQNLRNAMDSTTHKENHFTEVQKNNIREAINFEVNKKNRKPRKYVIYGLTAAVVTIFALLISTELIITSTNNGTFTGGSNQVLIDEWEVRNEYEKNDKVLFSLYPDPALTAGKPYGYIFSFTEPFKTFEGKELAIYAQHYDGERIIVLAPTKITEPSPGYTGLERFTHTFEVPVGGLWKFEVYLDDQFYGDVIMSVREKTVDNKLSLPKTIPNYVQESDFAAIDWERKAVEFGDRGIIGNENKSGVIGADMPTLNGQKWMWHLWGVDNAELTVVGFHKETQTIHQVLYNGPGGDSYWTRQAVGENNGADAHMPSNIALPKKGEWAFLLYTNDELFDILVYDINE
ncbi:hypothetical protein [Halalkalibacter okhensis]|uniref:DUF4871 domain-containing protein n=1 Tax=Halalkalibacter okhensis TaxID=333138 RepID=A0A0B0I7V1_9BACI|nr:hypothetical protein [Halalkalibacter okhensis]KHF38563.1 hypothetical protein LQ50_20670 [Halalkalibacter okhensis]